MNPIGDEIEVKNNIEGKGQIRYSNNNKIEMAIYNQAYYGTYNNETQTIDINLNKGDCFIETLE